MLICMAMMSASLGAGTRNGDPKAEPRERKRCPNRSWKPCRGSLGETLDHVVVDLFLSSRFRFRIPASEHRLPHESPTEPVN